MSPAKRAADPGLVDHLLEDDVPGTALRFATTLADRTAPGPVLARQVQNPDPAAFNTLAATLETRARQELAC